MFDGIAFARPMRTYLEYLDALPVYAECEINVFTETWRWSTPLNEFGHQFLAPFDFKFGEHHRCSVQLIEALDLIASIISMRYCQQISHTLVLR
jgi:hypothetical protein